MRLKITQSASEAFDLDVESDSTIESIQLEISKKIGISTDNFKLSYTSTTNTVMLTKIPLPPSSRLSLFEFPDSPEIHIDTVTVT